MASYQIRVHDGVAGSTGFRVLLLDERERSMGELDALNRVHARRVAHDLIALMRHRDPTGAFVVDTHIEGAVAA